MHLFISLLTIQFVQFWFGSDLKIQVWIVFFLSQSYVLCRNPIVCVYVCASYCVTFVWCNKTIYSKSRPTEQRHRISVSVCVAHARIFVALILLVAYVPSRRRMSNVYVHCSCMICVTPTKYCNSQPPTRWQSINIEKYMRKNGVNQSISNQMQWNQSRNNGLNCLRHSFFSVSVSLPCVRCLHVCWCYSVTYLSFIIEINFQK